MLRWHVPSSTRGARGQTGRQTDRSGDTPSRLTGEGVERGEGVVLCALEPPLVPGLHLEDVEVAPVDGGGNQLVAAALVAVGGTGQGLKPAQRGGGTGAAGRGHP